MFVLGVESSCDETAASVVGPDGVLSDVVYSQAIHEEYGGVVPELAARAHVEKVGLVVRAALERAGIERPDGVAATAGPGLIGAVLVGLSTGKAMAAGWRVPFVGVNHLEGHMLSPLLKIQHPNGHSWRWWSVEDTQPCIGARRWRTMKCWVKPSMTQQVKLLIRSPVCSVSVILAGLLSIGWPSKVTPRRSRFHVRIQAH